MGCGSSAQAPKRYKATTIVADFWNATDKLYCHDGEKPQLENYMRYLGFDPTYDGNFVWLSEAFMKEPLPSNMSVVVKPYDKPATSCAAPQGYACFVNAANGEETDLHPYLHKYRRMLKAARLRQPGNGWQSIMTFRIEFLVSDSLNNKGEEQTSDRCPLIETPINIMEMAQIFGVSLLDEPYLGHVLKKALINYTRVAIEKRVWSKWLSASAEKHILRVKFGSQSEYEDCKVHDAKLKEAGCSDVVVISSRLIDQNNKHHDPDCYEASEIAFPVTLVLECEKSWAFVTDLDVYRRLLTKYRHLVEECSHKKDQGALAQAQSPWFAFADENGATFYCTFKEYPASIQADPPPMAINKDLTAVNKDSTLSQSLG